MRTHRHEYFAGNLQSSSPITTTIFNHLIVDFMVYIYCVIDLAYLFTGKSGIPIQTIKHLGGKYHIVDFFYISSYD